MTKPIRKASFNRKGFNLAELEQWRKRTKATPIRVTYKGLRATVVYQ